MSTPAIYPRLTEKLFGSPLMLHQPTAVHFGMALLKQTGIIESPAQLIQQPSGEKKTRHLASAIEERTDRLPYRVQRVIEVVGSVAVVFMDGVIDKHVSSMDLECYGGCDLADIDAALSFCRDEPTIAKVVIVSDTPGGSVIGVHETALRVAELARMKPVYVYIQTDCCSAGYYIASQATHIVSSMTARVGSIGVILAIVELEKQLQMDGVGVQVIKGGKFKDMGAFWRKLTEEEWKLLEARSAELYNRFKSTVTSNRLRVSDDTMQGQCFDGIEAEDRWLVDELTGETLDEFVSRLLLS